ncbi:MAG: 2Fe-2S iron-sulfur cluster-binding protein [Myxococcales bacterium]|nr:2Fe-2S iron-sulfur cluster-binding protein [Myxococcales bacterium]
MKTNHVMLEIDGHRVLVVPGTRVLDARDDHPELGLNVHCRGAHCGTCAVRLQSDPCGLEPPDKGEVETLAELGLAGARLGCQIVVSGNTTRVVLRSLSSSAKGPS